MILPMGFMIKRAGIQSLIQDAGRFGFFNLGLTNGGPLDKTAFQWANRLCGNSINASAIEINLGGLELIAQLDTVIALTGANMSFTINGMVKNLWRSYAIKAGDIIKVGFASEGIRCYLAVAGGFILEKSFGSTATVCREKIGGIAGKKLEHNDILSYCAQVNNSSFNKSQNNTIQNNKPYKNLLLPEQYRPKYSKEVILRTVLGYQQQYFSKPQQTLFFDSEYTVSQHYDRMGYRLQGQAITCDIEGVLSEGICHGAVQIPADGQPIVLLNDRQTIGGYPKIGSVISIDTAALGQLTQGGKVRFQPISMEKARSLYLLSTQRFTDTDLITCD